MEFLATYKKQMLSIKGPTFGAFSLASEVI